MFGGIIEAIGEVQACEQTPGGGTLAVLASSYWQGVRPGASIAIDGVCLTVASATDRVARFDVVTETLRSSTLGALRPGDRVNLQKALALGDRIDGHFVQGHVDAIGIVAAVEQSAHESMWWFSLDQARSSDSSVRSCIVPKGSVAINGISLTIAAVRDDRFAVALIPTTLRETTLESKRPGDRVNIETDVLARTVVNYLQSLGKAAGRGADQGLLNLLKQEGFA